MRWVLPSDINYTLLIVPEIGGEREAEIRPPKHLLPVCIRSVSNRLDQDPKAVFMDLREHAVIAYTIAPSVTAGQLLASGRMRGLG
ncbi:MAG: hypothetical protein GHCLOJNM_01675 [bacterium]|nr:hypothetical protein [bacterium]